MMTGLREVDQTQNGGKLRGKERRILAMEIGVGGGVRGEYFAGLWDLGGTPHRPPPQSWTGPPSRGQSPASPSSARRTADPSVELV